MAPSELRRLLRQQPVSTYAASDIVSMPISSDTMCVAWATITMPAVPNSTSA